MCAIFGFIAKKDARLPLADIKRMAASCVRRGPHAFGFAWVTPDGRLRSYKQTGRITDHLGVLSMARDAVAFIGHVRWATHGSPDNNLNNHPHPCDGGWLVHNGIVHNYDAILRKHDLSPVSECDSEAIALLVESEEGRLLERTVAAVECCDGDLATLSLWARPTRLVAARSDNPLHVVSTEQGRFLATVPDALPGRDVFAFTNDSACEFTRDDKGDIHARVQKIAPQSPRAVPSHRRRKADAGGDGEDEGYHGG